MSSRYYNPLNVTSGIYPMLYLFFFHICSLRYDPFRVQVDTAVATDASGIDTSKSTTPTHSKASKGKENDKAQTCE